MKEMNFHFGSLLVTLLLGVECTSRFLGIVMFFVL